MGLRGDTGSHGMSAHDLQTREPLGVGLSPTSYLCASWRMAAVYFLVPFSLGETM